MIWNISIGIFYTMLVGVNVYALTSNYGKRFASNWYTWTVTLLMITTTVIAQQHPKGFMFKEQPTSKPAYTPPTASNITIENDDAISVSELRTKPNNFQEQYSYYRNLLWLGFFCLFGLVLTNEKSIAALQRGFKHVVDEEND